MIDEGIRIHEEGNLAAGLLETSAGRLFCGLLLQESGFLRNALRETPELTAFAEGERHVGQRIFELLWKHDESKPLACMSEYGEWMKQLEAMSNAAILKQIEEDE